VALSDPKLIQLINDRFVPVWINVRDTPIPNLPRLDQVLIEAKLDEHRMISNLFSLGFFVRAVVLNPEADTILNYQTNTIIGRGLRIFTEGSYSYAQLSSHDLEPVLRDSLERFQFLEDNRVGGQRPLGASW
jgi:hypothetical protein